VPYTKVAQERRRWERLPLAIPVFARGIDERGKDFLDFTTVLEVSAGGAVLAIRRNLARSTRLTLEIPSAPLNERAAGVSSVRTLRAKIVRVSSSDRCQLCALEFIRPIVKNVPVGQA
jgi:hypothetical protein